MASPNTSKVVQHVGTGVSFGVTVLVGVWVGMWADKHWKLSPWCLIAGSALGFGLGLFNFIREFTDDDNT